MSGPRSDEPRLIGGPEQREIVIAAYDPAWPRRYEALARAIRAALGATLLRIEHVGSTSVPGREHHRGRAGCARRERPARQIDRFA